MRKIFNNYNTSLLFVKILIVVLVVEGAIMAAFTIFNMSLNGWQETFLDVLFLALISTPLVYLFCIRPYVKITESAILAEEESKAKLISLIEKQKITEDALNLAQSVAKIGSWSLNQKNNQLVWSDEIFRIFGVEPEKFGASLEAFLGFIHPDDLEYVKEQFERSLGGHHPYDIDHRIVRRDTGEVRWVHEMCIHQYDGQGNIVRSDGTVQDITERKREQDEIRRLAMTDHLTGLANRNQLCRRFYQNVKIAKREDRSLALLLLDLDKFKPVNDTYGHQAGDDLLVAVARILQDACREIDVVARFGGDEFAILLVHPVDAEAIEIVANRIIDAINQPISIQGKDIMVGISIGISQYPADSVEPDSLIQKADQALYEAKKTGRNNFTFYRNA